jgi:hypothetical protein
MEKKPNFVQNLEKNPKFTQILSKIWKDSLWVIIKKNENNSIVYKI